VSGWPAGTAGRAPSAGDVSVVIRTFDTARWNDLQQAVASVRRQTVPPREVIVVVDHNPDLLALATAWLPGVRVVQNGEARGASGGMNSGVAAAGGDVVAFLDDDAVAAPDWLEQLLYPYRDSRVLGVGGWIEPGRFRQRRRAFTTWPLPFYVGRYHRHVPPPAPDAPVSPGAETPAGTVPSVGGAGDERDNLEAPDLWLMATATVETPVVLPLEQRVTMHLTAIDAALRFISAQH
jgi:glycosyltransferase involved in cell wall biosynthesis